MFSSLLFFGCDTRVMPADASGTTPCPGMDCPDELTLTVLRPDGTPSTRFSGWVRSADGAELSFDCLDGADVEGGSTCAAGGRVRLELYSEALDVSVTEGPDQPSFTGTVTPAWDAPHDSEACGHYCYVGTYAVTLEPCDGCG
jgi:hypothetical protein